MDIPGGTEKIIRNFMQLQTYGDISLLELVQKVYELGAEDALNRLKDVCMRDEGETYTINKNAYNWWVTYYLNE